MNFIGTNFGHSSSCCLVNSNGELIFAIEEDRITRIKNTAEFPIKGLEIIGQIYDLNENICFSEGWNIDKRLIYKGIFHTLKYISDQSYIRCRLIKELERYFEGLKYFRKYKNVNYVGHHISHAYSLVPCGLIPKSLIMVSDTIGENESISFFYWDESYQMKLINRIQYPNSIGSFFHQFAYYLGFKGRTAPGKLMALSSYGKPLFINDLKKAIKIQNTQLKFNLCNYPIFRIKDAPDIFLSKYEEGEFKSVLASCKDKYENGYDIACSIQSIFEEVTNNLIEANIRFARNVLNLEVNHLGLVGGAALNCQANGLVLKHLKALDIDNLFISPWSDDSGTSIGAAYFRYNKEIGISRIISSKPFLGPAAIKQNIYKEIDSFTIARIVTKLLNGSIFALVDGRIEFGPRALGGRCIISNSFSHENKKRLNNVKKREFFMPFAPCILEEDYSKLFLEIGSEHMAWTVESSNPSKLLTSSHPSNRFRVQVVKQKGTLLYKILKEVQHQSGLGILVLTSLNESGVPTPISIEESKTVAQKLSLDGIIFEGGFIEY